MVIAAPPIFAAGVVDVAGVSTGRGGGMTSDACTVAGADLVFASAGIVRAIAFMDADGPAGVWICDWTARGRLAGEGVPTSLVC